MPPKKDLLQQTKKFSQDLAGSKTLQYLWLMRICISLGIFFLTVALAQTLSIMQLSGRVNVIPFPVVEQNSSKEAVRAEPLEPGMDSILRIREMFIRNYIVRRESLWGDVQEMQTTQLMLARLSTYGVFAPYARSFPMEIEQKARIGQESREIRIVRIDRDTAAIWKVYFETMDYTTQAPFAEPVIRPYIVTMTIGRDPGFIMFLRRLRNPFGFYISEYMKREWHQ